ncbi:hypothetical protein [Actinomadura sp. 7K507]|uniref:hypothetical protein n=1 Tax=Actinomadura sp. 7K507 TaxID=2530365 RepID=UPI00104E8155|nr:hypothetical protein [Actinomadura sp. 7K507]TDC87641.1 hypothetical protein E1285_20085 [Actinomadura sp. 7K507]
MAMAEQLTSNAVRVDLIPTMRLHVAFAVQRAARPHARALRHGAQVAPARWQLSSAATGVI